MANINLKSTVLITLLVATILVSTFGVEGSYAPPAPYSATKCAKGETMHLIEKDETCWKLTNGDSDKLKKLLSSNKGMDCNKLMYGVTKICLPDFHY